VFERFTTQARSAVTLAQQEAHELGRPDLGTRLLLLGILHEPATAGGRALAALGVGADDVREDIRRSGRERAAFSEEDADALRSVGVDLDEVRRRVEEAFGPGALERKPCGRRGLGGHMPFTPGSKKALELALREAIHLGHRHIGTEHLLLGLVRDEGCSAALLLASLGVDRERVRAEVLRQISAGGDQRGRTA
jgi:ATP-dependent Clp protease ATP-binding subunit ClpA